MRLLKFVARKSLLALGYPKLELSHPELGVYEVGAFRGRMAPEIPACQFFYPVGDNSKRTSKEKIPYFRPEAVDGLLDFLGGFGDGIVQMLQEKSHPLSKHYGMDPLLKKCQTNSQFPLVVFSHGLSGTMEMYSQLCSQIASTGCVVVAVEHEDGSASYAETLAKDGTFVGLPYKRPAAKIPYNRENVVDFRFPMLEQRVEEISRIYNQFDQEFGSKRSNRNSPENVDEESAVLLEKIVAVADTSRLHLVGHSFGGATQLLAAQTWEQEKERQQQQQVVAVPAMADASNSIMDSIAVERKASTKQDGGATLLLPGEDSRTQLPSPRSITVFDAWNFALPESVLTKGLESSPTTPILSVLSETWATTSPEREQTLEFLRHCDSARSCYARNSVHQSVSDTESYVPSFAAQRIGNRGKKEPRHRTVRALVKEIAKFTKDGESVGKNEIDDNTNDDDDEVVLVPFPFQYEQKY